MVVSVLGRSVEVFVGELVADVEERMLVLPKVLGVVLGPAFSGVLIEGLVLLDITSLVVTIENELGLFLLLIILDASVKARVLRVVVLVVISVLSASFVSWGAFIPLGLGSDVM